MHAGTSANTARPGNTHGNEPSAEHCVDPCEHPRSTTLVGMFGVAMGVGFTIMMAGLMQGSQIDFLRQLVDTMPHVTVEDERRSVPSQPAEEEYAAVQMADIANVGKRPGIKYPESVMSS